MSERKVSKLNTSNGKPAKSNLGRLRERTMSRSISLEESPVADSNLAKQTVLAVLAVVLVGWLPANAATLWVSPEARGEDELTRFRFTLPADMAAFSSAKVVLVSNNSASIDFEAHLGWGGPFVDGQTTLFEDRFRELDISPLMLNLEAEEYAEVVFIADGATPKVLALRFEYLQTKPDPTRSDATASLHSAAPPKLSVDGGVEATSFTGDGSTLTALDPSNLSAGTAAIDISGTAATADDVIGADSVSVSELDFDPATEAELSSHAALAHAHHVPTVDTDTVLSEAQVEDYITDDPLDMGSNPITNIGAAGTDFTATGGLVVADDLRINGDLGIGTDPIPGTDANIYLYDGGIYSGPRIDVSGHNQASLLFERRRTDGGWYQLKTGCGSVNCVDDFVIQHDNSDVCIAIRNGCEVDISTLEVEDFRLQVTDSPGSCDGTTEGRLYYDASLDEPCFCNGSTWSQFDGGGGC